MTYYFSYEMGTGIQLFIEPKSFIFTLPMLSALALGVMDVQNLYSCKNAI